MLRKNKVFIIFAVLIFLIPLFDLFHPGLPITHDGQDHVARITNFYQNLTDGNIIPRWAPNLNWGYGHPILMFLYPLPSYFASFFHFLNFSFVDSAKLVFGLAYIASGLAMYLWVREFLNDKAALLTSILYTYAPYRFIDLYVRGAIGEHVAFIFPPLVLYFLLKLSKRNYYFYIIGGAFSMAGLILSHNAISLMFLPIILLYLLYLLWQINFNKYFMFWALCLIFLGFGLSVFFWLPAFFEGKYTLRDIVTKGTLTSSFVDFRNFLYGKWSYGGSGHFSVQIGILHWIFTLLSIPVFIYLFKKKNKLWIIGFSLFLIFWIVLFLMTPSSQFLWEKFTILQKFQFAWRLLSIIVFITSVFGGLSMFVLPKKIQNSVIILLVFILLFLSKDYWNVRGYLYKPETFYTSVYNSTTDTGESAPIWSVRFMEKTPASEIEVIDGQAEIRKLDRKSTKHTYSINAKERTRIRENTLYFPGWKVYVDGQQAGIQFQDPDNRGLMTFFVEQGEHIVNIKFEETKVRYLSNLISLISLGILLILGIIRMSKFKLWLTFR